MKKRILYVIMAVLVLLIGGIFIYRSYGLQEKSKQQLEKQRKYAYRYVMIVEKPNSSFWTSVYEHAKKAAAKKNALLEMMGKSENDSHSTKEYMQMAIALKVDGIILSPDGSEAIQDLINEAEKIGIPVITVMGDESFSRRKTFVGLNSYQLGRMYADLIYGKLKKGKNKICIIYETPLNKFEKSMVFNQTKENLLKRISADKKIDIIPKKITSQNFFKKEEIIRNMFRNVGDLPDILVCMDDMETEYVSQAIIDYNCVGKVSVIGYYQSSTIVDSIKKGIVQASIVPDTKQVAKYCIDSLDEFQKTGHTNEYYSVDCQILTKKNLKEEE